VSLDVACCIAYVLILLAVIGWLAYELRADTRDPRYTTTVPGPRERLPPKSEL
jgi:hypothetical protein